MRHQTAIRTVAEINEMGRKPANQCHDQATVTFSTREHYRYSSAFIW